MPDQRQMNVSMWKLLELTKWKHLLQGLVYQFGTLSLIMLNLLVNPSFEKRLNKYFLSLGRCLCYRSLSSDHRGNLIIDYCVNTVRYGKHSVRYLGPLLWSRPTKNRKKCIVSNCLLGSWAGKYNRIWNVFFLKLVPLNGKTNLSNKNKTRFWYFLGKDETRTPSIFFVMGVPLPLPLPLPRFLKTRVSM